MKGRPRLRACLGLGLIAAGLAGLALSGDLIMHIGSFAAFYGLSLAGFALLATAATSLPLRGALVAAVLLRLIFLPGVPSLSTDAYRYAWDGRVQLAGANPYLYAPSDRRLDRVVYAWRDRINHAGLRTPYPPLAEGLFAGVAAAERLGAHVAGHGRGEAGAGAGGWAGGHLLSFKLLFGAFDLLTAAAIWWLAGPTRRTQATVLYLMCPAVIVQTWEAAHLESVAVCLVVLAAAALLHGRDWQAGAALGLAAAFRITPAALLVPALIGGRAKPGRFLAGFVPALVLPYVPYVLTGGSVGSLTQAGATWTGGALLYAALRLVLPAAPATSACAALALAGAVWIARRLRGRTSTAAAFAWTLTLVTFCLPVIHAWYWMMPLALGLAAGVWLPVVLGLAAPFPEAIAGRWPVQAPPWRGLAAAGATRAAGRGRRAAAYLTDDKTTGARVSRRGRR